MATGPGTVGHFRLTARLGSGGMGEVWRATDTKLNREVAVKLLPPAFAADPDRLARFSREAQVLASLNHPNIAPIYGVEDRALIMELVEGETLAERIARGPIPWDEALPLAAQLADGLEYAHEKGVIHRDLKPANIKITPEGKLKILDFGLAKALATDSSQPSQADAPTLTTPATMVGAVLGTAAYMSPEQARGKAVDRRADIWGFGAVLFEMLSGRRAFPGEDVTDTLAAVLRTEPDFAPLPEPARGVAERCLAKDVRQRWGWIGDVRFALQQPPPAPVLTSAAGSRHALAWFWGWAALALLLGAGLAWWLKPAASALPAMHFSAVTTLAGLQAEPSFSPDGRSIVFISNQRGQFDLDVGLIHGGTVEITHDANLKEHPAWSPDGTTIAYARLNDAGLWDIWEIAALGGTPRRVMLNATDPSWSADGKALVYCNAAGEIWTSGPGGGNAHRIAVAAAGYDASQPRLSPDGRWVAYAARQAGGGPYGELAVADVVHGLSRLLTHDNALALSPAWAPDSRTLYFASSRGGTLNLWQIGADGNYLRQITAGEGDDVDLDVAADGKRLIFGTMRVDIALNQWDLAAPAGPTNPAPLTHDAARNQFGPTYSPDGQHLAYFTNLKGVEAEHIEVADANGANPVPVAEDGLEDVFPSWLPDSRHLVYITTDAAGGPVSLREVDLDGGAPRLLSGNFRFGAVHVGRDGRLLFSGANRGIEYFDPASGTIIPLAGGPRFSPGEAYQRRPFWTPDQHGIVYHIRAADENDPGSGIWLSDLHGGQRQIFRGTVTNYYPTPSFLYILESKSDLSCVLWKVDWDGQGLTRTTIVLPEIYAVNYRRIQFGNQFAVSPDGRHLAYQNPAVMQENIGLIELGPGH